MEYLLSGASVSDFKEDPYDLGSFDEIAHHRGEEGVAGPKPLRPGLTSLAITKKVQPAGHIVSRQLLGKKGAAPDSDINSAFLVVMYRIEFDREKDRILAASF